MRVLALVVICFSLVAPVMGASMVPVIPNAGFEDVQPGNDAPGWGGYIRANAGWHSDTANPHSGKRCMVFWDNSDIAPEVYELAVKEISAKFGFHIVKVKTLYDCASCLAGILLSFAFFGLWHFEGVKLGTIFCAFVNGTIIGLCSRLFEHFFTFRDGMGLKRFFT